MKPLVVETDIGRDADDLFALLYFIGIGAPLKGVCVSPGDHDQVAVVKALLKHFHLDVPVFTPKARVPKAAITPFHKWVMDQLGAVAPRELPDGHEEDLPKEPVEVFVCGPAKMAHLLKPIRTTFQGGFVPYSHHRPVLTLDKFEGKETCATFNLGGTKPKVVSDLLMSDGMHRWVGKNVCHTVVYTPEVHAKFCPREQPMTEATRLHKLFVEKYIEEKGAKAFHDPLAATLHYNADIGIWKPLKPERIKGEYTAVLAHPGHHQSLVDIAPPSMTDVKATSLHSSIWTRYFAGLQGVVPHHEGFIPSPLSAVPTVDA